MRKRSARAVSPTVIIQQTSPLPEAPSGGAYIPADMMQMFTQYMQQTQKQADPEKDGQKKDLLTVKEARAELFENAISEYKLYEMLRQGVIPAVRVGTKYLLRRSTITEWMSAQEQSALSGK